MRENLGPHGTYRACATRLRTEVALNVEAATTATMPPGGLSVRQGTWSKEAEGEKGACVLQGD